MALERDRHAAPRDVVLRGVETQRKLGELAENEVRIGRAHDPDGHVRVTSPEIDLAPSGDDHRADIRVARLHRLERGDDERLREPVRRGDPHRSTRLVLAAHLRRELQCGLLHARRRVECSAAGLREGEATGGPGKERDAELFLERCDPPAHGGLIDPKGGSGAPEGALAGDREEETDVVPVERGEGVVRPHGSWKSTPVNQLMH
jgi:hypothetical protein